MSVEGGSPLKVWLEARTEVFLSTLKARGYSAATLKVYRSDLGRMRRWLEKQPELLCPGDIGRSVLLAYSAELLTVQVWGKKRLWSAATRTRHLSTVKSFFRFLAKSGALLMDPACSLEGMRKERKLPVVPSVDDVLKLLSAIDVSTRKGLRDRAAMELLYGSGLRISELLALDVEDLDFAQEQVLVRCGKGGKARLLPLMGESVKALREYLDEVRPGLVKGKTGERALFLSIRGGGRMRAYNFGKWVSRYGRMAGLSVRVTPHVLRHCCATHLLKGKAGIRHIQSLLGHASLSTTQIYTRLEISDLVEVVKRHHPRERF